MPEYPWLVESPPARSRTRPPLVFRVTIDAPLEVVFETFCGQPERWLCRSGFFEPRVDGRLRLAWPDGCVEGRIMQLQPPRTARFSWHVEGDTLPETMVVMSLQRVEKGAVSVTQVEVEHYGFGAGPEWEPLYLGAIRAWTGYLKNLRAVLELGGDLREADE